MDAARVLRVITRLNIGGPARQALLLTRELRDSYPTRLVAGTPDPDEGELADPDVPVTRLPLVRKISPRQDLAVVTKLRHLIDSDRIDLVHTHMAKAGTLGRVAAMRSHERPVTIHTFHGHVLDGYFSKPVQATFVAIERYLARSTDALVAVSDEVRDSLLALGIGAPERFHVIPLGFELDPLLTAHATGRFRQELGVGSSTFLVGVLGRLVPIKDHATLFRAIAAVPGAHLAVLGRGPEEPRLRALTTSLGIAERVHFFGWRTDIEVVIPDFDVVALTSRNEGSPVSLIEAHASGVPSIATDVGGVRSVIEDGVTGWLVAPNDAAAVAKRLLSLREDPELQERMGNAARQRARSRYTSQDLISDIHDLYKERLQARKRP